MAERTTLATLTGAQERREYIEFDVPEEVDATYEGVKIKTIAFTILSLKEMQDAEERAPNGGMKFAHEMLLAALWKVNDKHVTRADGSADTALKEMGPILYQLLAGEFARQHTPSDKAVQSFRASRRRKV